MRCDGVGNPAAAAKLRALAGFGDQAQAVEVSTELSCAALHQSTLAHLLALYGERHDAYRVVDLRRVGLQVNRLQLAGFQVVPEEIMLCLRILPNEELNRLAGAYE